MYLRKKTLISVLVALAVTSTAYAKIETQIKTEINSSEEVEISYDGPNAAIFTNNKTGEPGANEIRLTGSKISVANSYTGSSTANTVAGVWAVREGSNFTLGSSDSKIKISASGSNIGDLAGVLLNPGSEAKLGGKNSTVSVNLDAGENVKSIIGINVGPSSELTIEGDSLDVTVKGEGLKNSYGILAQGNSKSPFASLTIKSNKTVIKSENCDNFRGIVALSGAQLSITGDLTVLAENGTAIVARGGSSVKINENGGNTVTIKGDIDFSYDEGTSKTPVNADVTINLSNSASSWVGSPKVSWDGNPTDTDLEVKDFKVNLSNGGTWTPSVVEKSEGTNSGVKPIAVNSLGLNGGVVNIENADQTVEVDNLSGSGTINIKTSLDSDKEEPAFKATTVASGTDLAVNFKGITSDEVAGNQAVLDKLAETVDAPGATKTQTIAEGNFAGALVQTIASDGTITVTEKTNTVTKALADVSSLGFMAFRTAMNDVSARMGDLRTTPKTAGAWARYYGGQMKYGSQGLKNRYNTLQIGGDGWINNFYLGGTFSYTDGNGTLQNGSSDDKTYSLGVYGGWLGDDGQFVDVIIKRSRMKNEFSLFNTSGVGSSGSYHNWGTSLSVEYGWRLNCPKNGFFAEPQAELLIGRVNSKSFRTSAGVNVKQDAITSVVGRAGVAVGYAFPEKKGNAYAKASILHDWKAKAKTTVGNGSDSRTFNDDLSGTWGEFVVGGAYNASNKLQGYGEFKTTAGSPIRNPWQVNVGVRYSF